MLCDYVAFRFFFPASGVLGREKRRILRIGTAHRDTNLERWKRETKTNSKLDQLQNRFIFVADNLVRKVVVSIIVER